MFRGNNPATVDDKGRLKIPTAFKADLDEKYGQDFFVTSLDGKAVRIYPLPVWIQIEQKLAPLPSMNKAKKDFLDRTNYWGQMARADAQGRVLIPAHLRESAGMQGEVAVIGHLEEYLEVWSKERVHEPMSQPFSDENMNALGTMGI
ncbi:MAG TPA: division/cell wall cluster transcriptional repressor MraZ [Terriglobia bacterium]|nr:division/cell wall cluster transcriptional repressor MraZ [Terriglobia bacterium]